MSMWDSFCEDKDSKSSKRFFEILKSIKNYFEPKSVQLAHPESYSIFSEGTPIEILRETFLKF